VSDINSSQEPTFEQTTPDPFDPDTLRLSQDFASTVGVKKVLTTVRCRKPDRQEFVRVRAGAEWRVDVAVFLDHIESETYLVAAEILLELAEEVKPVCLRLAINKQGDTFLWPLKLPRADGRSNPWHQSAIDAANLAEKNWIRVSSNMGAGIYDVFQATGNLPEPTWPELSFRNILELSFRQRRIDSHDHPILRSLLGEV